MSPIKCCSIFNLFLFLFLDESLSLVFKMKNVFCESYNKTWIIFPLCRLKAINRNLTVLNLEAEFLYPANKVKLNVALQKKANGFKPFLYNFTIDACEFLRKPNNPAIKMLYSFFKDTSNINHTCPYTGKQILKNFYLKSERLAGLPIPSGEYAILMTFYFSNAPACVTNVYFIFSEY